MLKQIIFILKDIHSSQMQSIVADIGYLATQFSAYGVRVSYRCHDTLVVIPAPEPGSLYLADDGDMLEALLAENYPCIALQHEENHRENLVQAMFCFCEPRYIDFDSFLKAYQRLKGLPWHILDTERLIIRESTVADVDVFSRIYQDPEIRRHLPPQQNSIAEEKAYAADYIRLVYGFHGYGIWTLSLRGNAGGLAEVIGRAGLSHFEGQGYPELGFIIAAPHRRKGYAEEALRAILNLARSELGMDIIQAMVRPENTPSLNLCRKLGFTQQTPVVLDGKDHLRLMLKL